MLSEGDGFTESEDSEVIVNIVAVVVGVVDHAAHPGPDLAIRSGDIMFSQENIVRSSWRTVRGSEHLSVTDQSASTEWC